MALRAYEYEEKKQRCKYKNTLSMQPLIFRSQRANMKF